MWPQDPTKYSLIRQVIQQPESSWRPLTYWNTVVKNLHQTYKLLAVAKTENPLEDGYYRREHKDFIKYGLLNSAGRPSRAGQRFLRRAIERLTEDPDFFNRKNVNPFEFEYLFHKELYGTGARAVFNNLQDLLRIVPEIHVDDLESIVSVVAVNNGDSTLEHFHSLSKAQKNQLYAELVALQRDLLEAGGKIRVKPTARPDWLPYVDLISIGALGGQNDGYYRAASLLKAHLLLLTLIRVREGGTFTFADLYTPFRTHITEQAFARLLRTEPEIEEIEGSYRYVPNRTTAPEEIYEEEVNDEIQKIRYSVIALTEEEKLVKIKTQLRAAERTPVVTVARGEGRHRATLVRHVRDPKTSAAMREYFKDVCQLCGFDGKTEYGVGIAEVDHAVHEIADTQNNRPSNLVVLCRNCHGAKTKGVLKFTDHGDHFMARNTFTGVEKRINKADLS